MAQTGFDAAERPVPTLPQRPFGWKPGWSRFRGVKPSYARTTLVHWNTVVCALLATASAVEAGPPLDADPPSVLTSSLTEAAPPPSPSVGTDFLSDARMLMQIAACIGDAQLPSEWPSSVLQSHCAALRDLVERYRKNWIERTRALLTQAVPADVPKRVVYPFGGGDLFTALHAFPAAEEYTTISLESAGDIRNLASLSRQQLLDNLARTRDHLRCLFAVSHHKTTNLSEGSRAAMASEITFALIAFSVFDYEPTSLRYFRLDPEGNVVYLSSTDLDDKDAKPFANVEIAFRARQDAKAPVRVYRHFAANLDDKHFSANQPLALHLGSKGRVSVLVKAASYLLWFDTFSHVRAYLLDNADWMLSDSTGVQPSLAQAAGFEHECWGVFHGPFLANYSAAKDELLALWQASPRRALPFYFGYPDIDGHGHMMVARRTGTPRATSTATPTTGRVSGGAHWRIVTPKGPVHVWEPRGYDAATAGTVLYVHGFYTNVDKAWSQHALAEQFAGSRVNALFVVPEAPAGSGDDVSWPVLADLLAEVQKQLPGVETRGPIVAAGHSGAWRTLGLWADEAASKQVDNFILLDGLYGMDEKFQAWLARQPSAEEPRLTLVSADTAKRAASFLESIEGARRRAALPENYRQLTPVEKKVPVLDIAAGIGHMEIITTGKVLPVLLHRSSLRTIKPPRFIKPKPNPYREKDKVLSQ